MNKCNSVICNCIENDCVLFHIITWIFLVLEEYYFVELGKIFAILLLLLF